MDWFSWLSKANLEASLVYEYGLAFARNELQLEDASYFNHEFLQSMGISIAKHRLEILKLAKKEDAGALVLSTNNNINNNKFSGVIKRCLRRCLSKLVFREEEEHVKGMNMNMMIPPEPNWYQGKWRRALMNEELKGEKGGMQRSRTIAMSGPLDGRMMHEKMVNNNNNNINSSTKVLKLSGPLDAKVNERMVCPHRSPIITRPPDARFNFMDTAAKSPRISGPLDARIYRSPRLTRPADEWADSPMGYHSPYNRTRADSDYDETALWPTMFEDLKPT